MVASPVDVQTERDLLPRVLEELNGTVAAERGLRLELYRWETDAYPGFHPEGPQGLLDPILKVETCDILIGIFWKRFGTPTAEAGSGTEHEILRAYAAWRQNRRPQIMVYFKEQPYWPRSKEELDQWGRVIDFRARFPVEGLSWQYGDETEFERLARTHLTRYVLHNFGAGAGAAPGGATHAPPGRGLDEMLESYREGLSGRLRRVYVVGEGQARELTKVFVELTVVEEYRRPLLDAEYLGLMDAELRLRRAPPAGEVAGAAAPSESKERRRRALRPDELLGERTQAVITGAPGCGKTTLLRYLAWRTLEAGERLPVYLELKSVTAGDFERAGGALAELLFERAFAAPLARGPGERERLREHFFTRLQAGGLAVFLDGLDEVRGAEFFPALAASVGEFTAAAGGANTLILSTRPYALRSRFEGLKEMEIAPLGPREIEEFLQHYYGDDPRAGRLSLALRQRRQLREIVRVPFLLSVVAQLYLDRAEIIEDRLELYRQIVLHLAHKLDAEKSLPRPNFHVEDPGGALKLDFLRQLAFERLFGAGAEAEGEAARRLVFDGDTLLEQAKTFLLAARREDVSPHLFAEDIKATPLLREIGAEVYAFTHLTIQEYLAAQALSRRADREAVFCRAVFSPTVAAMEALPMALGLVPDASRLHDALDALPESLAFTCLRLRARSLAYARAVAGRHLSALADRLADFVEQGRPEENAFLKEFALSFSAAGHLLEPVVRRIEPFLHPDQPNHVRWTAAMTLGKIGDERAVRALRAVLDEGDYAASWFVVKFSAHALREIGTEAAVAELLSVLAGNVHRSRRAAAEALGGLRSPRVVDALMDALRRDIPAPRAAPARAARNDEYDEDEYEDEFGEDEDEDEEEEEDPAETVRETAADSLGAARDARAVVPLLEALSADPSPIVRMAAAESLGEIGDARAVDGLLAALGDDSLHTWIVIKALGKLGDPRAVDGLLPLAFSDNREVRRAVGGALADLGAAEAIGSLCSQFVAADIDAKIELAEVIGNTRDRRVLLLFLNEVLPALPYDPYLFDDDYDKRQRLRQVVVRSLGDLGDADAVETLLAELESVARARIPGRPASSAVMEAVAALDDLKDPRSVEVLLKALEYPGRAVPEKCAAALGAIGDARAVGGLIKALSHRDSNVRWEAVKALGAIGDAAAAEALKGTLGDSDAAVRQECAYSLARMDDVRAVEGLLLATQVDNFEARSASARGLGRVNPGALAEGLRRALTHADELVRLNAARAVGYYVSDPALGEALSRMAGTDPSVEVRRAAADARDRFERKLRYFV